MPLSIVIAGPMIKISGNTYDHKEYFKGLGGNWESKTKSWMIPNEENREKELNEYINKHKGRCGFCGESEDNRTKCAGYTEQLKHNKIKSAILASKNMGNKFEMLKNTQYCSCYFEDIHDKHGNIWRVPVICKSCDSWCYEKAELNPKLPKQSL